MSGQVNPIKRKIDTTYLSAIQNLKFSAADGKLTKGNVISNLKHNIDQLNTLKSQVTALLVDSGNKFEDYNSKLKNATQDYSKRLYHKKVDRFRIEVLELIQKMETLDESIKNMEETIEKLIKEGADVASESEQKVINFSPETLADAAVIYKM